MAVAITRTDLSTEELRGAARRTTDTYQARRLLALALVVDGASRTAAARAAGMERQTLRDWVHRYNAEGVEGLCDRARSGRPPRLSEAQLVELARLVEAGPDSGAPWRGALALRRPSGGDQAALRGRDQRASRPPELNPTENIWEYLRKNYLALRVFDDYDAIVDACCAWPGTISSPCPIDSPPSPDENGPRCHELRRLV